MLEHVAEGSVCYVVAQAGHANEGGVLLGHDDAVLLLALDAADAVHHLSGQVAHAEAVLEAVVAGAGEDEVGGAELLELTEALELRGVHDLRGRRHREAE